MHLGDTKEKTGYYPSSAKPDQNSRENRNKQRAKYEQKLSVPLADKMLLHSSKIFLQNMFHTHFFSCSRHPWTMNVFFL